VLAWLGDPFGEWSSDRGDVRVWIPAPGVFVTQARGHMDKTLVMHIADAGNECVRRHQRLLGFHEWSGVRSYDSDARAKLTDWGMRIRKEVDRVHFLVSSKILRMGIAVASIVLVGMLVAHDDPAEFERLVREAVTKAKMPTVRS
jgi:hypothetical protein